MSPGVAVVTGANRGIGRAIAVAFATAGFTVTAGARDPASLADTIVEAEKGRRDGGPGRLRRTGRGLGCGHG